MISFQVYPQISTQIIQKISENFFIEESSSYSAVVAEEGDFILGILIFETQPMFCKILYIEMFETNPLAKDALVKTLINTVDLRGIFQIIAKNEGDTSFLCEIGFSPLNSSMNMIDLEEENSNLLILNTEDFYKNKCCNKK